MTPDNDIENRLKLIDKQKNIEQAGVAIGLHAVEGIEVENQDNSKLSTQALIILRKLKNLPIGGEGSEVDFSQLTNGLSVWVRDQDGVKVGSIEEIKDYDKVSLDHKIKLVKTSDGLLAYSKDTELVSMPINVVYLALLSQAVDIVKEKLSGNPLQIKVFTKALGDDTTKDRESETTGAQTTNEDDAMTAMQELGVIWKEVQQIKKAQEHQKRSDEIEPVYHAFKNIENKQQELAGLNAKFAVIDADLSLTDDEKTDQKSTVQSQINKLNADLETSRDLTKDKNKDDIDIQYKALVADNRLAKIIAAHEAIQAKPDKPLPTPAAYAKYASLVFADGYESIRERLVAKRIEIDRKIVETPNLIMDITGKLQNEKAIIEAQLNQLDEGTKLDPGDMWLGLFGRMQNGELTHEQSEVVKLALENPEDRDKTQKALLLALESNGFKSKYEKEVMNDSLQRLLETWGSTLFLFGMQKIAKLLDDAT